MHGSRWNFHDFHHHGSRQKHTSSMDGWKSLVTASIRMEVGTPYGGILTASVPTSRGNGSRAEAARDCPCPPCRDFRARGGTR